MTIVLGVTLTPLDPARTVRRPTFRAGREQAWEATSADGRWTYVRLEQAGTPWAVFDAAGAEWRWFGTLTRARRATASHDAAQAVKQEAKP